MPDQSASSPAARVAFGQGFLKDCWWFAALSQDLKTGALQRYVLLGEPVLLGRDLDGKVYGIRDICPHRAAPLSAGQMLRDPKDGGCVVQCPYHGWTFDTDGTCTSVPSLTSDQTMDVSKVRVRNYAVREQQGMCGSISPPMPVARPSPTMSRRPCLALWGENPLSSRRWISTAISTTPSWA